MKLYIKAMSDTRKNIMARLDETGGTLIDHLIKFHCYPNYKTSEHWKNEIYGAVHKVSRLKSSNKFPAKELIFDSLWTLGNSKTFSIQYANVLYEYGETDFTEKDTKEYVINYLNWISEKLSEQGIVFHGDVDNYLANN